MANTSKPRPKGLSGPKIRGDTPWGLSPSDFAFLWDDCPRCFYLKVARKQPRPSSPFPSVFGRIDRAMKEFYLGERAELMAPGMPEGVIGGGDRWVKSAPLLVPGSSKTCLIRGRVDALVDCDDGTTGVVDFKTTIPKPDHIATYGRQLHAYAMALEHPSSGRPSRSAPWGCSVSCPTPTRRPRGGPASTGTWSGSRSPGTTRPSPAFSSRWSASSMAPSHPRPARTVLGAS